jgi:hypothetical protein
LLRSFDGLSATGLITEDVAGVRAVALARHSVWVFSTAVAMEAHASNPKTAINPTLVQTVAEMPGVCRR